MGRVVDSTKRQTGFTTAFIPLPIVHWLLMAPPLCLDGLYPLTVS